MSQHLVVGSPEHTADLKRRAETRMAIIDTLLEDVRSVIHEYGWAPVRALRDLGITSAGHLRHVIKLCRNERT